MKTNRSAYFNIWLATVFLVQAVVLPAQNKGWHFWHLSEADGLFSQLGTSVVEDKKNGYLWFGSRYAVQRFDGEEFVQVYPKKGEKRLPTLTAWLTEVLLFDSKGWLWFWEAGRIMRFSSQTQALDIFSTAQSGIDTLIDYYPSFYSLGMFEDSKGRIWLNSNSKGLQVFDPSSRTFSQVLKSPARDMRSIGRMVEDKEGWLWLNLNEQPCRYNPETGELIFSGNNPDRNPLFNRVASTVFMDSNENLWWGGWRPLIKYSLSTGAIDTFPNLCNVSSMVEDKHGRLWFTIHDNQFIDCWDPSTGRFTRMEAEPWKSNGLWLGDSGRQLHLDSKGNMWVLGSHYVNMFRPDDQVFFMFNTSGNDPKTTFPNGEVNDFYQTADGTGYVIYWHQDCPVVLLDSSFAIQKKFGKAFDPLFPDAAGWKVIEDSEHKIWITQQSGRVTIYDPVRKTVRKLKPPELKGTAVERLIKDRHGDLWFGLWGHRGLTRWDCRAKKFQHFDLSKSVKAGIIKAIVEDPREDWLWLATDYGLLRFDKTNGQVVLHQIVKTGFLKHMYDYIMSMLLYEDSVLILGHREGLFRFNIRTAECRRVASLGQIDLPIANEGMLPDANNRIWYGYDGGLVRYDPANNDATFFRLSESLQGGQFPGRLSYNRLRDGRFFAAFGNSFTIFDPLLLPEKSAPSAPVITHFHLSGGHSRDILSVDSTTVLTFSYDENFFTVHFSRLTFFDKTTRYSWRLYGLNPDWSEPQKLAFATFTNVPPGEYPFEVKAISDDGLESPVTRFYIHIEPPYWATWWFRLLAVAAISGLFYAIFRYREMQRLRQEQLRLRIARDLHDEVGSTLSSISILSASAMRGVEKDLNNARLGNIGEKARAALDSISDIVWSVNPQNDSMEKVLARMSTYASEMLENAGAELRFEVGEGVETLLLPMEQRKDFYLIFKEAIHNIVKYARARQVEVALRKESSILILSIKDDGVGFDTKNSELEVPNMADPNSIPIPRDKTQNSKLPLGGNGLQNMRSRAAAMGADFQINSAPGAGTIVLIKIPVS